MCHLAEEKGRNSVQPDKEIRHCERNDKCVGFGAKVSCAAHKEDDKSVSKYRQDTKRPAKNPKPGFHVSVQYMRYLDDYQV